MSFTVVIPARLGGKRFHAKLLQDLAGKTVLQHTYEKACASGAERVVIAADDEQILEVAQQFDAQACLTSTEHSTGSDRIAEVCERLAWSDETIVVNLQGDEPAMAACNVSQVAGLLDNYQVASLYQPFSQLEDLFDPSQVKVVCNQQQEALYFTRAPVPWDREHFANLPAQQASLQQYKQHLGIYAYRVAALRAYHRAPQSSLEQLERLEQLRFLHHGIQIHMQQALENVTRGVNTLEDLQFLRRQG